MGNIRKAFCYLDGTDYLVTPAISERLGFFISTPERVTLAFRKRYGEVWRSMFRPATPNELHGWTTIRHWDMKSLDDFVAGGISARSMTLTDLVLLPDPSDMTRLNPQSCSTEGCTQSVYGFIVRGESEKPICGDCLCGQLHALARQGWRFRPLSQAVTPRRRSFLGFED